MRNFIKYSLYIFILSFICSCVDDKGNYTYKDEKDILPISIGEFEKEMTIEVGQTLSIIPEIEGMDNPDKYTYEWYVMEYQVAGKAPERQDIGNTKDLNYKVTIDPGVWRLSYKVIDKETNIFSRAETKLNVISTAVDNKGWYILKDNGEETDFDYINFEGTIYKDVLRKKNLQLPGTAISMEYQQDRYYHNITDEHGNVVTLTNQSVFHVLSSKEIYSINAKKIELFKNFEEQFYSTPEECDPQYCIYVYHGTHFLQNAGRLYTVNGLIGNIGKVFPITGTYKLYKGGGIPMGLKNCIVYDEATNSLLVGDGYNDSFIDMPDLKQDDSIYSFKHMPYSIVCIAHNCRSMKGQGYIVLKHKDTEEGALLRAKNSSSTAITSFSIVPKESKLLKTDIVAPAFNADFVYFKYNNAVYSYENAKDLSLEYKEKEVISYPEGETITAIKQAFSTDINQLAVLTTKDEKWKLYIYDLLGESNPEINPKPVATYEGEGNGRFLLFRSN